MTTHFTSSLSWDLLEGRSGGLEGEITLERLTSNTWFDTDSIVLVSTSVHSDEFAGEVEELGSGWEGSLGKSWEALSLGETSTTGGHETNGDNDVHKVEHISSSLILDGWDGLDRESVRLGLSKLGSSGIELEDEIATSDHCQGTSNGSLGDGTVSGGLDELKANIWSGRTILPGWDTPWELHSNEVSTFGHGSSGGWKGEVDGDGGGSSHGGVLDNHSGDIQRKDTSESTRSTVSGLLPFVDLEVRHGSLVLETNTENTGGSERVHGNAENSKITNASSGKGSLWTSDHKGPVPARPTEDGLSISSILSISPDTSWHTPVTDLWVVIGWEGKHDPGVTIERVGTLDGDLVLDHTEVHNVGERSSDLDFTGGWSVGHLVLELGLVVS